ncbi:MAG TPA: phytanoyl-CoA dioxygenase family protein [Polyangiaceae bacterium]|jgi:2-oxoglutarate-dependent dioxygenase
MPPPQNEIVLLRELSRDQVSAYRTEGYLILRGLVGEASLERLRSEVLEVYAAWGLDWEALCRAREAGDKLRLHGEYLAGSTLDRLINSAALHQIAGQLLDGPARVYLPFAAIKLAGGGQFHFHQDNQYTRHEPALGSNNNWLALEETTRENGCLMLFPRSHQNGTLPFSLSGDGDDHRRIDLDPSKAVPILLAPGDAVTFSRLTVHGSGPNRSGRPRLGYAVQFTRDDIRWQAKDDSGGVWQVMRESQPFNTQPVERLGPKDLGP